MKTSILQTILTTILLLTMLSAARVHAAPPPLPDFVIKSLSIVPTNATQGMPITVTITVKNQGEAAGDARHLDIWSSMTSNSPVFGDVGDWWTLIGHLEPGASRTIVSAPIVVANLGVNRLFACIEFEDLISETSNTNNWRSLDYYAGINHDPGFHPTNNTHYALTVIDGVGGGAYAAGRAIAVTADADPVGQVFAGWTVSPQGSALGPMFDASVSSITVTLPLHDVTLTANFTPHSVAEIYDNVPVAHIVGNNDSTKEYMIVIPPGTSRLNLKITGGTGDCDLYVRYGAWATQTSYDYRPDLSGNNETVFVISPMPGSWYIMLHASEAYDGVTLVGHYSSGEIFENDSDGDGCSDIAVFHQEAGNWYIQYSTGTNAPQAEQFGWWDVVPVPADYDGDGTNDIAVYYPFGGMWYIQESSAPEQMRQVQWGWSEAAPVPGDYDGDGKADLAVFHQETGNWFIQYSTLKNTPQALQFGWRDVVPIPADYDGDGLTDIAVYYPFGGMWYIQWSSNPGKMRQIQWGWSEAVPVPGDYDGDGKADIAVFHRATGNWYIQYSMRDNVPEAEQFGWSEVVPVPADYDGDGKTDIAVYYPDGGMWYIRESITGEMRQIQWGWRDAMPTQLITVIHDWFDLP